MAPQNYRLVFFSSAWHLTPHGYSNTCAVSLKPSSHVSSWIVSAWCHCYFSVFLLLNPCCFSPAGALVQSGLYVCTLSTLRRAQQKHCWRDVFAAHMQRIRNSFFLKHEKKSSTKKWDIRAKGKNKSTNCVQNVMWI